MTDDKLKKVPVKRRGVSKARLFKELKATINGFELKETDTIETLMDAIKDDIVTEALGK